MLGVYDKGRPQYVDHTGTGFSEALLKGLFGKLKPHFTDRCPFMPKPKANAPVRWGERRKTGAAVQELLQALNGCIAERLTGTEMTLTLDSSDYFQPWRSMEKLQD